MKRTIQRIGAFLLMLCMLIPMLTGCAFGFRALVQNEFDALLDQMLVEIVSDSEFNYKTVFKNPGKYGLSYKNHSLLSKDILKEQSKADVKLRKEALQTFIEEIEAISPIILKDSQKASYYALLDYLHTELRYVDVVDHGSLVAPSGGFIANLSISFYEYPFDAKSDIKHYLKFLENIPDALEIVIEHTKQQIEAERYALTEYVKSANDTYLAAYQNKNETPFLGGFDAKIEACDFLSKKEKAEFIAENKRIFEEIVAPGFKTMRANLQKLTVSEAKALGETEAGRRYYEYLLERESGTRMTVSDMKDYLEQKLATNMGVLRFYAQKNFQVNLHRIKVNSTEDAIAQLQEKIGDYMPAFRDPGCTLTDLPEAMSVEGMLAYYLIPQADNTKQNIVRLNRKELGTGEVNPDVLVTIAHESYPGHLYQVNYWRQNDIHPLISWMGQKAVTEGWAEYVSIEALGWLGASEDEVRYLRASWVADRIVAMLADIEVNYYGKNGEELNTYLCARLGISGTGDHFSALHEVLVADPCSYAPYAIGVLQIMDLVENVEDKLEDAYNQKAFFEALLMAGSCQFESMKDLVYKRLEIEDAA